MRKIIIFLLFVLVFSAENYQEILKQVPKNDPQYQLDLAIVQRIKSLKYSNPTINLQPKNEYEYKKAFYKLVKFQELLNTLPKKIDSLNDKISILQNSATPVDKLQKIFYQKMLDIYQKELNYLTQNFPEFEKKLYKDLKNIVFNIKKAKENISFWNSELLNNQKKIDKLNIDFQKWQILNKTDKINEVKSDIDALLNVRRTIYKNIVNNYLTIWLNDIKNKNKNALKVDSKLLNYARDYDIDFYNALNSVVTDFEKFAFGSKLLVYNTKKEVELTFQKLWDILNYPLFKVGNRSITPFNFLILILILVVGWYIGKYYKKLIYKLRKRYNISYSASTLLANMGYYIIITVSFLLALKAVGLDLSSLTIIAGALSVGIGFGLQNVVSNFVSGIILMFENSIKVGDYIQIDENTRGEVIDISMRSTVIRTNDNIDLIIPNQTFIQNNVINWTLIDDIVRFRVPFGVEYGSDIDRVEKVILNALEKSGLPYVRRHHKYDVTPRVVFEKMGDSSLNFELFVWVNGEYARRPRGTKSEFLKMIYKALNEAGIGIPFPQQDLHIKDSVPFEIIIRKDKDS
ncbi:mechanosensitive ion channel family protein [Caminibacter sp.]